MTSRVELVVAALAGAVLVALSFVNAWIAQTRELRGEGYRVVETAVGAWRGADLETGVWARDP